MSHSINISILWIEEWDSDENVLLAERIIPTGIMACYQVTLDIALRWSAGIRFIAFYRHGAPLELGNLEISYSINMPILRIEKWILSSNKCYFLKELLR